MANFTTIQSSLGTNEFATGNERSIVKAATFSSGSPQATQGYARYTIDATGLPAGAVIEIRRYLTVGPSGTQRQVDIATIRAAQAIEVDMGLVVEPWDVTVKLISGSSPQTIGYVVKQDINQVSITDGAIAAATFAAGAITSTVLAANAITSTIIAASAIGASQLGAAAITAAKFATDAIDANALAAAAVTKIQSGLALAATALSTAQWTNARAALQDNIDLATSTRAPLSSALSTAQWTNARAAALDLLDVAGSTINTNVSAVLARLPAALVGGRVSADVGSWLGTAAATPTVAGIPKVEDATTQARLTSTRAGLLDNLSLLDTASSAIGSAVTAVGSAIVNVQSRIPASLVGGSMPAAIQSMAANTITAAATAGDFLVAVAGQITGTVIGTARDFDDNPITVTVLGVCKLLLAQAAGKLSGITGLTAGAPVWRDPSDTKDVIRGVVTSTGRTAKVDPT